MTASNGILYYRGRKVKYILVALRLLSLYLYIKNKILRNRLTKKARFGKVVPEPLESGFLSQAILLAPMSARLVRGGKTMYAIIECGGKQYKVEKDELVRVEKLDAEVGAKVELKALLVADDKGNVKAGAAAKNAKVLAEVSAQDKYPKILVFHYKSKKQIRKRQGHRQPYTELKILSIEG